MPPSANRLHRLLPHACAGLALSAGAVKAAPAARWSFDDETARECVSGRVDRLVGRAAFADGVRGRALKSDEFSTAVTCAAKDAPSLASGELTIEAWIAPRAFPWNEVPVATQRAADAGWSFTLDYQGRVALAARVGGAWVVARSAAALPGLDESLRFAGEPGPDEAKIARFGDARPRPSIPLLRWTHVAGTIGANGEVRVYIDGRLVGEARGDGKLEPADTMLTLGRTTSPLLPLFLARPRANIPRLASFDGLLDEICLHARALDASEVMSAFASSRTDAADNPPLSFRRMPTAQEWPGRFGAFSARLPYDEDWDRTRRFDRDQDIFVRFDSTPCTFVAWNGTIYPIFYAETGDVGQQFEAFETWSKDGCHEAMMDRQNRHSSWRVVENTPARVVLHWRHALVAVNGKPVNVDPATGWGDWVDDYYTIYPDAVIARRTTLRSTKPVSNHSYAQDNSVLQPGLMPWDVYEREPLSVANLAGQETIFTMGRGHRGPADPAFAGPAVIQLHRFRTKWKPFMIAPPGEVFGGAWTNDEPWPWFLPCWHHWPTAQLIESDGSITFVENGRPKSSCLTNGWGYGDIKRDAVVLTEDSLTRFALHGMTDLTASALAPLARSWRQPPALAADTAGFVSAGWSVAERAYLLDRAGAPASAELAVTIAATKEHPLVRPGLVLRGWGEAACAVTLDGAPLVAGRDFRIGHRPTPAGVDLVVWLDLSADAPLRLVFSPP